MRKRTHRYTDIPSDAHTKIRLGIALSFERAGTENFYVLNGDAVSDKFELEQYLTTLGGEEYIVRVTISCNNSSIHPAMAFIIKKDRTIPSMTIIPKGGKWLRNLIPKKEPLWG